MPFETGTPLRQPTSIRRRHYFRGSQHCPPLAQQVLPSAQHVFLPSLAAVPQQALASAQQAAPSTQHVWAAWQHGKPSAQHAAPWTQQSDFVSVAQHAWPSSQQANLAEQQSWVGDAPSVQLKPPTKRPQASVTPANNFVNMNSSKFKANGKRWKPYRAPRTGAKSPVGAHWTNGRIRQKWSRRAV